MKRRRLLAPLLALAALTCGLVFDASAEDPFCVPTCQELLSDCIAQAQGGSLRHCLVAYQECLSSCGY